MAALRSGTRRQHRATERWQALSGWLESPGSYVAFLRRLLTFHRLLEAAVAPVAAELPGLEFQRRRRSPVIAADLRVLSEVGGPESGHPWAGHRGSGTPADPGLPLGPVTGVSEALGCLYVVEGATLGGRVTAEWVHRELGFGPGRGASSLVPYGAATAEMWRRFADVVEGWAAEDGRRQAVMVAAARRTFAGYSHTVLGDTVLGDTVLGDMVPG